jgi:hypothetical protein
MPILEQLIGALDSMAVSAGLHGQPADVDALCGLALRGARRARFKDVSFRTPLRHLLECVEREGDLTLFGRYSIKWDALRSLANLLRFEAQEEADPAILNERIERPIFITGFPRSGTTLLHTLIAEDRAIFVPRCFETISPYPYSCHDRRREQVDRQLRMFQGLAPQMAVMHPLSAEGPQECTEITAQVFQSLRYEATYRVPSYQAWLDRTGHLAAYRFHKRFLRHLQHQKGAGRWILKSPDHIHALKEIETVYPDRGIVMVHRDPLYVAASAMRLTEVLRRPFARSIDRNEIGKQVVSRLMEAAQAAVRWADSPAGRDIFHLHYACFAADPLSAVEALYRHFDLEFTERLGARMAGRLAMAPKRHNRYSLEEYGFRPLELCEQFGFYMDRFDVHRETGQWKRLEKIHTPVAA